MGKKRKTHKEKLIADLRRKVYSLEGVNAASFDKPLSTRAAVVLQNPAQRGQNQVRLGQNQYPYLLKDILKTGILTASIIAVQILLFLILKNNILSIPGVSY